MESASQLPIPVDAPAAAAAHAAVPWPSTIDSQMIDAYSSGCPSCRSRTCGGPWALYHRQSDDRL